MRAQASRARTARRRLRSGSVSVRLGMSCARERRTNVVVMAVGEDDNVLHASAGVERLACVVVDGEVLDKLAETRELDVWVCGLPSAASVKDEDCVSGWHKLSVDVRMFIVYVVDLDDEECRC